jgi:hypothetical protein
MSWAEFKKIYDYLHTVHVLPNDPNETNIRFSRIHAARALDSLGHCDLEFSEDTRSVYSAPPVLARLPRTGIPQAVLAGARSPQTIPRLIEACKATNRRAKLTVNEQLGESRLAPTRVVIQADYAKDIAVVGCSLGIKFETEPPAWRILHFSASLDEYRGILRWSPMRELNWLRKDFSFDSLSYVGGLQQEAGVRLSRYINPVQNLPLYLIWKEDQCAKVDRDWGRFLALKEAGVGIIKYDPQRFLFAIPRTVPLPRLMARALTLCSGYMPQFIDTVDASLTGSNWMGLAVYQDVPPQVAQVAATKLGQEMLTCTIDMRV